MASEQIDRPKPFLRVGWGRASDYPSPCRCGHSREAHEHYRAAKYCGRCGELVCPHFRPASRLRRLLGGAR
jgi:hypothetical protein